MKKAVAQIFILLASGVIALAQQAPPKFVLAVADITSAIEMATNKTGAVEVSFRLSDSKTDELLKFARKYSGAPQEEIWVGPHALMKPGMYSKISISNAVIRVSYPASESDYARALAASLNKK